MSDWTDVLPDTRIEDLVSTANKAIAEGISPPLVLAALETHLVNRELKLLSALKTKLVEMRDELKTGTLAELNAFFERLRKTVALNRGQSAEVLATSVLAHLEEESRG